MKNEIYILSIKDACGYGNDFYYKSKDNAIATVKHEASLVKSRHKLVKLRNRDMWRCGPLNYSINPLRFED